MKSKQRGKLAPFMTSVCGIVSFACSAADPTAGSLGSLGAEGDESAVASTTQKAVPDYAVPATLSPLRALEAPGGVYLTGIDQRLDGTGTFTQTIHVYQPDAVPETIRFELAAKTSTGQVDGGHRFESVVLTSRPGEADQSQQTLPNATGQRVYDITNSRQGWYRLQFRYVSPNFGRTLSIKAYDAGGRPLKMAWSDPPSTRVQVRASVNVESSSQSFLKGGAYRSADRLHSAYADNVTVDGRLLYRRAFDQGLFNFPLGRLSAGPHVVEFSLSASNYSRAKFWFGVNEKTFHSFQPQEAWKAAQFLYYGEMHTADYDAWNEGVAFAQGAELANGVRPPPVRRGTSFGLALEHPGLNGSTANATLRIYPYGSSSPVSWSATLAANSDYAGGIYTSTGFSTRYREHWRVSVPATAPVGRYVLRATAPNGTAIGEGILFYVLHDPYPLVASGAITKPLLETFGYDEDDDGVNMRDAAFGSDHDAKRDHFTAIYYPSAPGSGQYTMDAKVTGAFRRTGGVKSISVLDHTVAAIEGTTTEFDSMRRIHRMVSQRRPYGGADAGIGDISSWIVPHSDEPVEGFSVADAALYSKPGTELLSPSSGVCYTVAGIVAAHARSVGILSRAATSRSMLGGWGEHAFTEVYIPDLPRHGGTTTSSPSSPISDTDPWYVFDVTDPAGNSGAVWTRYSQAIGPRSQYGRAELILEGPYPIPVEVVTNGLNWDPFQQDTLTTNVTDVSASYAAGPEYWLTSSGVKGWLGYWEKDVYRVNPASFGASRLRVRTLPHDGEYLQPKLCVAPATNSPVMPQRCANPSTSVQLPAGDSYVVVFSDTEPLPRLRGDSVEYILERE